VHIPGDISTANDPEGITCDPNTGNLYIASGQSGVIPQVLVYSPQLVLIFNFSVEGVIRDPQGIVYDALTGHLFIVDSVKRIIFEFTTDGKYIDEYDISSFPGIRSPQGLAFAPSSDPTDDPNIFHLYIADAQVDNDSNPNELDGKIFEAAFLPATNITSR
jgi:DNA-binding beta-propeller fold protein YncE